MKLFVLSVPFLLGVIDPSGAGGCDDCGSSGNVQVPTIPGTYTINVLAVSLADDDGSNGAFVTQNEFLAYVNEATASYKRSDIDATFVLDARSNFDVKVKSTLLNSDCVPKTTQPQNFTKEDVNNDGTVDDKDSNAICDKQVVSDARNAYALRYPANVVVFIRYFEHEARWDAAAGHWTIFHRQANWGFSGRDGQIVVLTPDKRSDQFLAHEIGHYMHLAHTHRSRPATLADAQTTLTTYLNDNYGKSGFDPQRDGMHIFDQDYKDEVGDTNPDPGPTLFQAVNGAACDPAKPTVSLSATSHGTTYHFTAKPDRTNVMNYFKRCDLEPYNLRPYQFSNDQAAKVHRALADHRKRLQHPELESCYEQHGLSTVTGSAAQQRDKRAEIIEQCLSTLPTATRSATYVDMTFGDDAFTQDCPEF